MGVLLVMLFDSRDSAARTRPDSPLTNIERIPIGPQSTRQDDQQEPSRKKPGEEYYLGQRGDFHRDGVYVM